MQAARRSADFDVTRRLGRRTEAGPRQLLRRVSRRRPLDTGFCSTCKKKERGQSSQIRNDEQADECSQNAAAFQASRLY